MNIMFISLVSLEGIEAQNIYSDLLRTFVGYGHQVFAVVPRERRTGLGTELEESEGVKLLHVAIGNVTKNSPIEKGLSLLKLKYEYLSAIEKHRAGFCPDIVVYTTPPTTIAGVIGKLKRRFGAQSYLLLKDIFPQNSVDLGMLSKKGIPGLLYRYFKHTEKRTYEAADYIGCMSQANVDYLLAHESWINRDKVEVNPNSIVPRPLPEVSAGEIRKQLGIPQEAKVVVYGGNLGKPQAIETLIDALKLNEIRQVCHFVICGDGTDRPVLESYFKGENPCYATLLPSQPVDAFNELLASADAGLILLDSRFTIPNFPSRLLSYLQACLPVIAATDSSTDIGLIAEREGFGVLGSSETGETMLEACSALFDKDYRAMGAKGRRFLETTYSAEKSYEMIVGHFSE